MKFNITIPGNLIEFKEKALIGSKIREMDYDLYLGCDVMIGLGIGTHDFTEQQLVSLCLFDVVRNDFVGRKVISRPLTDARYCHLESIKELFGPDKGACVGYLTSFNANQTIDTIERLIRDVWRVNKLRAFV